MDSKVNYIPGARANDIKANLKVLTKGKSTFTQLTIKLVCMLAKQMSQSVTFSGPTSLRRGDEIYSSRSTWIHNVLLGVQFPLVLLKPLLMCFLDHIVRSMKTPLL